MMKLSDNLSANRSLATSGTVHALTTETELEGVAVEKVLTADADRVMLDHFAMKVTSLNR